MSVAIPIPLLQNLPDVNVTPAVGVDEYALTYNHDTARFVLRAVASGVTDHGALTGLTPDDDHTQYALLAGRAGGQTLYGGTAANDDITIHGTSDATRTTSYVILQPTAGNVGIGTTAPTAKFSITGTSQAATAQWIQSITTGTGTATDEQLQFGIYDGNYSWIQAVKPGTAFRKLCINPSGGAVGIGTTSPATSLHVTSTTATTNAVRNVLTLGTDVTGVGVGDVNLGPGILFQAESTTTSAQDQARILSYWSTATHETMASKLAFQTRTAGAALATAMTIDGAGKVGIGTTSPASRLDIDAGALTMAEMTAPTGEANKATVYARDNGAGKTMYCAKLGDNDEVVLATQSIGVISANEDAAANAIPHAGTLTLPQAMEYANGGVYNVKAYGATGDGVTDDKAAIQAALDAADDAGGGTVLVPATSEFYLISDALYVYSNTVFTGEGAGSLIKPTSSTLPNIAYETAAHGTGMSSMVYVPSGESNVRITNLHLDGKWELPNAGTTTFGVFVSDTTTNVEIANCRIVKSGWSGCFVHGTGQRIHHNYFEGAAVDGVEIQESDGISVHGNVIVSCGLEAIAPGVAGIEFNTSTVNNLSITDNYIYLCRNGILSQKWAGHNFVISGNTIESPLARGIDVQGKDSGTAYLNNVTISNNIVRNTTGDGNSTGIYIGGLIRRYSITGNTVDTVASTASGIYIVGGSANIPTYGVLSHNIVANCWIGLAIYNYATDLLVEGNAFWNNGAYAVSRGANETRVHFRNNLGYERYSTKGAIVDGKVNSSISELTTIPINKDYLVFSMTSTNVITLTNADNAVGVKIFDFPVGHILILGAVIDGNVTVNDAFEANPNDLFYLSVGTAGASGADPDLTGTEADIIAKTTIDTAGNTSLTDRAWHAALSSFAQFDGSATAKDLYVNAAVAGTSLTKDLTIAITGSLTITWINLGNY